MLNGIDVSHWQGSIDWQAVARGGYHFAVLKATESTNYTDPTFAANRARARAAGLVTGAYHFARYGDPIAEADRFCSAVGSLAAGEFAVLDWEIDAADPVTWSRRWLDRVAERLGVRAFVYMNQFHRSKWAWKQIADLGHPLWLAKYDGVTDQPPGGPWPVTSMKQFTDKGKVPGISGGVDVNVFYGDLKALTKYGKGGSTTEEDDMFSDEDRLLLREVKERLRGDEKRPYDMLQSIESMTADVANRVRGGHPAMDSLQVIQWMISQVTAAAPGDVDEGKLAAALVAAIPESIAEQVAQKLAARLAS